MNSCKGASPRRPLLLRGLAPDLCVDALLRSRLLLRELPLRRQEPRIALAPLSARNLAVVVHVDRAEESGDTPVVSPYALASIQQVDQQLVLLNRVAPVRVDRVEERLPPLSWDRGGWRCGDVDLISVRDER